MTIRIHKTGRDPLLTPQPTQWQAQRSRGPILPMEQPRRGWWARILDRKDQ